MTNKGAEMFMLESGFDVENMFIDRYACLLHWFDKISNKKFEFEEFCSFCDQEYRRIIKHVSTRWLSLENANTRTLRIYQPF